MIEILALVAAVVALGVAVFAARGVATLRRELGAPAPAAQGSIADRIAAISVGDTEQDVVARVGSPDATADGALVYRLDEHAGYLVELSPAERVTAVRTFKS